MSRCTIILNPWAGKGAAGARRPALEQALTAAQIDYELLVTHARGGATELAWQAAVRGAETIVAVGGDGTINEIVNGIKGAEQENGQRARLAIVPIGTGSDFVRVLAGVEAGDVVGAVARIVAGRTQVVDLGHVSVVGYEPRFFINGLGMGLDAQVAVEASQITSVSGMAVYFLAIIRALAKYRANPMTVQYDQEKLRRRLLFASVANGRFQGGGFMLTPNADIADGLLDLCLIENLRLDQIIRYLPRLIEGTHVTLKQATMGRARQVHVESATPIPVATDGEVIATNAREITVDVAAAALDVVM